jgi:hypothetical protein
MNRMLIEKSYPHATTCVVLGRCDGIAGLDLNRFREVLWIVDAEGARQPPTLAGTELQVAEIETARVEEIVDAFVLRTPNRLPSVFVSSDVLARHTSAYESAIADLHAVLEGYHRARETRQKDGFKWQEHVLRNVPFYLRRRLPAAWRNALAGIPAFVCGAGPSLDASGAKLTAVASRGILFSADSALRALAKHGVSPDFVVSIDVAKTPEKCLPPTGYSGRLIRSIVSPPSWESAVPKPQQYFLGGGQLTLDWIAAKGVPQTEITVSETCGSTALDLARFLGCTPIYLFGMDLAADAADPAKRHHAGVEKSIYTASGYNPSQSQPMVPGNYVDRLPTFMFGDWRALDARIAAWPAGLVVNVNDRGARLSNTTLVHPDNFAPESVPAVHPANLDTLLAEPVLLEEASSLIAAEMRRVGAAAATALPRLRAAVAANAVPTVVAEFRAIFGRPEMAQPLGAFSLKLMPHLLPPVNPDPGFWRTLVDEFETLVRIASSQG